MVDHTGVFPLATEHLADVVVRHARQIHVGQLALWRGAGISPLVLEELLRRLSNRAQSIRPATWLSCGGRIRPVTRHKHLLRGSPPQNHPSVQLMKA